MKKLLQHITSCCILALATSLQGHAQSMSPEDIKAQMVKEWERAKVYTTEYLNAMPADKYDFRPVDSIRSFAQQMLHLAQANVFLMSSATGVKPLGYIMYDMERGAGAQKKDSVVYYVNTSYDFCINAVRNSDVSKWAERKKFFSFEESMFALMLKTFEHQTHHRGQTTIYIRQQGIKPPEEKLF